MSAAAKVIVLPLDYRGSDGAPRRTWVQLERTARARERRRARRARDLALVGLGFGAGVLLCGWLW